MCSRQLAVLASSSRRSTTRRPSRRSSEARADAAAVAPHRRVRHGVPRDHAGGRDDVHPACPLPRPRPPPLRLPRALGRVGRRAHRRSRGSSSATSAAAARSRPCRRRSVDTTMGFTPLEGRADGDARRLRRPRCAALPPAPRRERRRARHALEHESGLLGPRGSGDVAELLQLDGPRGHALALEIYCYRDRPGGRRHGHRAGRARRRSSSPPASASTSCRVRAAICAQLALPRRRARRAREQRPLQGTSQRPASRVRVHVVPHVRTSWSRAPSATCSQIRNRPQPARSAIRMTAQGRLPSM